jgi:hypothetical protein
MTPVNSGCVQNFTGVYFLLKLTGSNNKIKRFKGLYGEAIKIKKTNRQREEVISFSNESEHIICVKLTIGLKCQTTEGDAKKCQA